MIERTFRDITGKRNDEDDQEALLASLGWSRASTWNDLLRSRRVLLISEAGAGKTYECQTRAEGLYAAGEPAFFVELAALATGELRMQLTSEQETRLDSWLASQSDMATFFLDSIDELKLTRGSFELALKGLERGIAGQFRRARIVITTRPIHFDAELVQRVLPVPRAPSSKSRAETFAETATGDHEEDRDDRSEDEPADRRTVELMPLSDEQVVAFSRERGVDDPERLLEDLRRRNAQEFARRPQDLIELCADWRGHGRIRTHREQVATNVRVKLLPREDRPEPAELSVDKAIEGASRLALASQVTRRLTIRHSAEADVLDEEAALDPAKILSDWQPNERKALLERPLFGFASYGRVRFHHRSVAEHLAAERLLALRKRGMTFRALKRLLFAETRGRTIVRPSMRPVAGWLALQDDGTFELLRDNEPAVLLNEGDPEALTQTRRNQALRAFADRYGPGGWRGLQVPSIQVHRLASRELADEIHRIWHRGVENPDVRKILIRLIGAGRIDACADIAFDVTQDVKAPAAERMTALDALVALDDERLGGICAELAADDVRWPDRVAQGAMLRLFPGHMPVIQLCQALKWTARASRSAGDLGWRLPDAISGSSLDRPALEELRDGLVTLVSEGLGWTEERQRITSDRTNLCGALAATCELGLDAGQDDRWLHAGALALRLHDPDHGGKGPVRSLQERLGNLDAEGNARLFRVEDALLQTIRKADGPWTRLARITVHDGPVQLRPDRDLDWVCEALGNTTRDPGERAMLLEAAIRLVPDRQSRKRHCEGLRPLVADQPELTDRIDDWLKSSKSEKELRSWEKRHARRKRKEERRKAKARASWVAFWREVADRPEDAFSQEKGGDTAWNLWRAMPEDGDDSRSSGWNRRFIVEHFNEGTADRLRRTLMKVWRDDRPSLPSERPKEGRNTGFVHWQLGLAGIHAEAEVSGWARKLGDADARRAARYAPVEVNGLPQWMEALADAHPDAVDRTLGIELSWELNQAPGQQGHSSLLQGIFHAPERVGRLFLPRLESWLGAGGDTVNDAGDAAGMTERVRQVTRAILRHGDDAARATLLETAQQRLQRQAPHTPRLVWLSTVMRIDPPTGVAMLEERVAAVEPAERSEAVAWIASLFWDREDAADLGDARFTPQLLLRLVRLAYRHVRVEDDAQHEGTNLTDERDDAERARNNIVSALLNAKGEEALAAKLEMAADPLCARFKDRILAMTEENWAQEIDADGHGEEDALLLDRYGEAPAKTNEAMIALMKDRLSDLDDRLLMDSSPREIWAGISKERLMRRAISGVLEQSANSIYTVDQEAVTGDEKETDIRLRSTVSTHEAVIELKLGENHTAKALRDAIEGQLVKRYMAAENRRAGALLVTLAKDWKWTHPDEERKIRADELLALLREEAERVEAASCGAIRVCVHFLDLRPRLRPEGG